jgi:hypothetical protein
MYAQAYAFMHTGGMADTSVRIDTTTRDRLKALAASRGMSLAAYLDDLSRQAEHQAQLGRATAAFDAALERPGLVEAFDEAFGGLPETLPTPAIRSGGAGSGGHGPTHRAA